MSRNTKLLYRWLRLYRVREANKLKGSYVLEEIDSVKIKRTYTRNRLKRFLKRGRHWFSPDNNDEARTGEETEAKDLMNKDLTSEGHKPEDIVRAELRVEIPEMPQEEKKKYVRFADNWEEGDKGSDDGRRKTDA
jgi:hypothetical protein